MPRSVPSPRGVRRIPPLGALLLVGFALIPSAAAARTSVRPVLATGSRVEAGSMVEIRWAALPPGVEEAELLLSVDDGERYVLRASPELDGRERTWLWRVPRIPAAHARLRLRARIHGQEILLDESARFEITVQAGESASSWQFEEADWWNGPDWSAAVVLVSWTSDENAWWNAAGSASIGIVPPRTVVLHADAIPPSQERLTAAAEPALPAPVLATVPRFVPPRE